MGTVHIPAWLVIVTATLLKSGEASAIDEHFGIEPVRFISEQISAAWADAEIKPAAPATDGEWCRRVHLDLIGRDTTNERVATTGDRPAAKIRELYLAALARVPTAKEAAMANTMLAARKGDIPSVLQDVWWAVLNSNEFIINH